MIFGVHRKYWLGEYVKTNGTPYVRLYYWDKTRELELFEWLITMDLALESEYHRRRYLSVMSTDGKYPEFAVFYIKRELTPRQQMLFKLTFGG